MGDPSILEVEVGEHPNVKPYRGMDNQMHGIGKIDEGAFTAAMRGVFRLETPKTDGPVGQPRMVGGNAA